jgi:hypothetical protein
MPNKVLLDMLRAILTQNLRDWFHLILTRAEPLGAWNWGPGFRAQKVCENMLKYIIMYIM